MRNEWYLECYSILFIAVRFSEIAPTPWLALGKYHGNAGGKIFSDLSRSPAD